MGFNVISYSSDFFVYQTNSNAASRDKRTYIRKWELENFV